MSSNPPTTAQKIQQINMKSEQQLMTMEVGKNQYAALNPIMLLQTEPTLVIKAPRLPKGAVKHTR